MTDYQRRRRRIRLNAIGLAALFVAFALPLVWTAMPAGLRAVVTLLLGIVAAAVWIANRS